MKHIIKRPLLILSVMATIAATNAIPVGRACSFTNASGTKCTWTAPVTGDGTTSVDYWDCGPADSDPNYPCGNAPTACNQSCDPN